MSAGPRNRVAFAAAQELHEHLRGMLGLITCPCCDRPRMTAKQILRHLPEHLRRDPRTVRNHVNELLGEIDGRDGNSSVDLRGASSR